MKHEQILELDFKDSKNSFLLDRREFLKVAGGGIFILFSMWDVSVFAQERQSRGRQGLPTDFNAFLRIGICVFSVACKSKAHSSMVKNQCGKEKYFT